MSRNRRSREKTEKTEETRTGTKVVLKPKGGLLLTFVHLLEPDDFGDTPKYTLTAIIPKKDKGTVKQIKNAINAAIENGMADVFPKANPKKLTNPLKDGDDEDTEQYPFYKDTYVLKFSSTQKPTVLSLDRKALTTDEEIYSGMLGYISGAAFPYNTKGNQGISFILGNVIKVADGEKIGGSGFNVNDEFGDILAEDEFDDDYEDDDYEDDDYGDDDYEDDDYEDDDYEDELDYEEAEELIEEAEEIEDGKRQVKKLLRKYKAKKVTDITEGATLDKFLDSLGDWVDDNE